MVASERIIGAKEAALALLGRVPQDLQRRDDKGGIVYVVGSYECYAIKGTLYLRKNGHKEEYAIISDKKFIIVDGEHRIIISELDDINKEIEIQEKYEGSSYPHFWFRWAQRGRKSLTKGSLEFVRIDFSSHVFTAFHNYTGERFEIYARDENGAPKSSSDGPQSVEDVEKMFGELIPRHINAEERTEELLKECGLLALCAEIEQMVDQSK